MEELTVAKLLEVKKKLDEAERRRPKTYINGEEYIIFGKCLEKENKCLRQ